MNIKQNKIAVVNWVFCQSFIVKPIWKYTNIQVLMTLKARKDFMVFKQRDLLWSGTYCSWLFVRRSYVYHYRGKRGRFVIVLWFSKIVRASKLTRQSILEINNAHLDRSLCWQQLQETTKKTFSFTVSWQKQIKLYFSSQNWLVI